MLTTARLISNGQEALPPGTFVNIRQDANSQFTHGTIDASVNTPVNVGDTCQLILDEGGTYNVVIKGWGPKTDGGMVLVFQF